ncbi:MAG TPA: transcriptional regulator [Acidimicrobiaceae bacterium]|nr:transcriptional regulator [Acidimicrobiaceae bacterium]MDP7259029.1 helix-turn-helix domain-containing protein [Acidimicrobiales bacterium]HCV35407.1 transcriptional regulator [Acidimicrobiaceae bacterium]HJO79073.1 helix-turn-helix domain-containing protein [Acidimicrobiales bacterium]
MSRRKHPLIAALTPIADAIGANLLEPDQLTDADLPLLWEGEVVGGLRRPDLHNALGVLITAAETELGISRDAMNRTQKQAAVALLNEWGAFTLRKSVEDVADALSVSRFTVYNYLERTDTT